MAIYKYCQCYQKLGLQSFEWNSRQQGPKKTTHTIDVFDPSTCGSASGAPNDVVRQCKDKALEENPALWRLRVPGVRTGLEFQPKSKLLMSAETAVKSHNC